jgi:hypothetical protein
LTQFLFNRKRYKIQWAIFKIIFKNYFAARLQKKLKTLFAQNIFSKKLSKNFEKYFFIIHIKKKAKREQKYFSRHIIFLKAKPE